MNIEIFFVCLRIMPEAMFCGDIAGGVSGADVAFWKNPIPVGGFKKSLWGSCGFPGIQPKAGHCGGYRTWYYGGCLKYALVPPGGGL